MEVAGNGSCAPGTGTDDIAWVPVERLVPGYSPRVNGVDEQHATVLAESDESLPPILVERASMRVVDGMHRLRAAALRGQKTIAVAFFEGSPEDAFVEAVQANRAHGLPLTLADREGAAARIVMSHPNHSDRAIAAITGLSAKTVKSIRERTLPREGQVSSRIGRDGRVRPVDSAEGRRVARDAIVEHPHASLREIARIAGISASTVRDVRERLRRGEDPAERRACSRRAPLPGGVPQPLRDRSSLLRSLLSDPALRFTESGRSLLRWLRPRVVGFDDWQERVNVVPPHSAYTLIELAHVCAREWQEFAAQLENRLRSTA